MSHFRIREFSPGQMAEMRKDWNSLADRCQADPLFMGWEWVMSWWEVFGRGSGGEWAGISAEDESGATVALCPLFRRTGRLKRTLPVRRMELVGGFWNGPPSVLTQYTQFLGEFSSKPGLMNALVEFLDGRPGWSELVFPMIPLRSQCYAALEDAVQSRGWTLRSAPIRPSRVVRLKAGFQEYLRSLSHKTRRRLFNQRIRLETLGRVEFKHVGWEDGQDLIELMNRFRTSERGMDALAKPILEFHGVLASRLHPRGAVRLSYLSLDGSPISVNYALRVGVREYGIQMGYDSTRGRGLSLGLLHLGYALEAAAADGIISYDLMTGMDEGPDWKDSVANAEVEMSALQVLRGRALSLLYGTFDSLRRRGRR